MADRSFGVKEINIIGSSTGVGTPTMESPTNLNLNANRVAISTDVHVGRNINIVGISTVKQLSDYKALVGAASSATETFTVTVASKTSNHRYFGTGSGSGYLIDGRESPFITLLPGKTYRFDQADGSNNTHQLRFYLEADRTTEYTTNVTFNGTAGNAGAYTQITVTDTTPIVLHYQCVNHGYMGNSVQTNSNFINTPHTLFAKQLSVSGVSTLTGNVFVGSAITMYASTGIISATTFYGNLVGSITDATNLTGGTANAASLNVSGIATISAGRIQADAGSNLRFGNLPAGSGSSGRNIAIGDQVLYSLSGGSGRNIGIGELSYYDTTSGQYNIGLGMNAGQKITSGSYNVIIGGYNGQTGLDIRTSSNNVVIADGQGNIRQYINSSGNVGIKTTLASEALTVSGVVSATSFYGTLNAGQLTGVLPVLDGSNLFGVTAAGSGVEIRDDGSVVGTAATIDFGSNLSVTFGAGIATVSASIPGINTSGTSTFNQLNVSGVSTFADTIRPRNITFNTNTDSSNNILRFGDNIEGKISYDSGNGAFILETGIGIPFWIRSDISDKSLVANSNGSVELYYDNSKKFETLGTGVTVTGTTFTNQLSISGNTNSAGIITASSFSGSGANLTSLPAGQLTGTLPAIDGSALLNVNATGSGIVVLDDGSNIGSAKTVNFGTGLDVTYSASGIATVTASGGSLQSRTIVNGITTSIANNGIGNTDITGFKSYALMKVGLSTAGWLRLYTDSASRTADASRSQGIDPAPGSGVIAEVITTGISTTQIITPFVMGGNLNSPADTTIYAAITNLSGVTSSISVNLTILQLEA